jgi:hypothetical protein
MVRGALQVWAKSVERENFRTLLSCQHWWMVSLKGEVANLSTWMYCLSLVLDEVT